jgi:PH/SEC7 domain-containing protein
VKTFAPPTPHHPLPRPPLPVPGAPTLSPIADVFSTTLTTPSTPTSPRHGTGARKPLPPGPLPQHTEETEDLLTVVVKKPRALPKIPVSPSATTRRSLSVPDDDKETASPTPAVADAVAGDHKPKENAAGWEDNSLHGLLDVFKGELSTLDPVSPASLDLRDPSTPARKLSYQSQANDLVLSAHENQGGDVSERDEGVRSPPISVPATPSRSVEQEDKSAPAAIIPPRSSSLQSPVYSIGSGSHATSSRQASHQLTPLRLGIGPAAAVTPSKHLRAVHRSSASSSEPSLIPSSDDGRVCE